MIFSDDIIDGVVVFKLSEKIMSCHDAYPLIDRLKDFFGRGRKKIIMDFSDVPWMNSQGVAMIVWAITTTSNAGGEIVFSGISDSVERVLGITKLDNVLKQYANIDEAIHSLADKA
jgi:anti-anti-sigma factor